MEELIRYYFHPVIIAIIIFLLFYYFISLIFERTEPDRQRITMWLLSKQKIYPQLYRQK